MSLVSRLLSRAGHADAPSAAPKGLSGIARMEEEEAQTLRRVGEDEDAQALRRVEEEEEETQPLRREKDEDAVQPLARMEEEEEAQTLRREEEEEAAQPLTRMEEEEEAQTLQRAEEEETQTLRRQEEEEAAQPLARMEEEEEVQTLRRVEEEDAVQSLTRMEEEEAQTLHREEEEEAAQPLARMEEEEETQTLRRMEPPDAEHLTAETSPTPSEIAAEPDTPPAMTLRREPTVPRGGDAAPSGRTAPGMPRPKDFPKAAEAEQKPDWMPDAPIISNPSESYGIGTATARVDQNEETKVVIEQIDVVIEDPAPSSPPRGAAPEQGLGDLAAMARRRYLGGL